MKIIWTNFAKQELKQIHDYYKNKASDKVAKKIVREIKSSVEILNEHQLAGQVEEYLVALNLSHRYILSGNYKVIYRIEEDIIYITDVFDTRRNPKKMISR